MVEVIILAFSRDDLTPQVSLLLPELTVSTMRVMLYGVQQRKKTTTTAMMTLKAFCFSRPREPHRNRRRMQE